MVKEKAECNMSISNIVIIVVAVIIIVALGTLYSTRKRLKEMEVFQSIKEHGKDDEGVNGSFGE